MNKLKMVFTLAVAFGFFTSNSAFGADVYVVKGFGSVFSGGMGKLNKKINKELGKLGVESGIYSQSGVSKIEKKILRDVKTGKVSYPIILIGHSAGSIDTVKLANKLGKKRIKTSIIGVDPGFPTPKKLGAGVQYAKAYKVKHPRTHYFKKGSGFSGNLVNVDVNKDLDKSLHHTSIDDSALIHKEIIKDIRAIMGR